MSMHVLTGDMMVSGMTLERTLLYTDRWTWMASRSRGSVIDAQLELELGSLMQLFLGSQVLLAVCRRAWYALAGSDPVLVATRRSRSRGRMVRISLMVCVCNAMSELMLAVPRPGIQ